MISSPHAFLDNVSGRISRLSYSWYMQRVKAIRATLTLMLQCDRVRKGLQRLSLTSTPRRAAGCSWTMFTSCRAGSPTLNASLKLLQRLLTQTSDASSLQSLSMVHLRYVSLSVCAKPLRTWCLHMMTLRPFTSKLSFSVQSCGPTEACIHLLTDSQTKRPCCSPVRYYSTLVAKALVPGHFYSDFSIECCTATVGILPQHQCST